jgi:molybdopterin biosynthesis enzyme MoaB
MGNKQTPGNKSRRWFLSLFVSDKNSKSPAKDEGKPEMVKMLTADGKLVEVDKRLLDKAEKKFKASNKDIFNWMDNPSKKNS